MPCDDPIAKEFGGHFKAEELGWALGSDFIKEEGR